MLNSELALYFFLQAAIILITIRVVGKVALKLGQPQVIGEMFAGILLGPSLFGALVPELHAQLFPKATISVLYVVSQLGLVFYMFLVGVEFQVGLISKKLRSAAAVSLAGIAAPFVLGSLLAFTLSQNREMFPEHVTVWEGMLFVGAAMSITAFPVLARIIQDRGLTGTALGTLTLGAASVDDAVAWCLLAVVLASLSGNGLIALLAIVGGGLYTLGMLTIGRRFFQRMEVRAQHHKGLREQTLLIIVILVMLGAFFTDFIGIHAVFGAFVLGTAMPRGVVTEQLEQKFKPVVKSFLLPLFFVYSGLNTQLGLVALKPSMWGITLAVLLVACLGKGVACWAAARLTGEPNREALGIGVLMNARGLTELIILNIGLDRGVIQPALFAIMVIMALATTLMTTPLFKLLYERSLVIKPALAEAEPTAK